MAKRGFFAELNHQAQQAERRRMQQQAAAARRNAAAQREYERAIKQAERAAAQAARADAAARKQADRVAAQAHADARLAEVAAMNAALAETNDDLATILAATLDVDDYVDLNELKIQVVDHPPFDPGVFGTPNPPVPPLEFEEAPQYVEPPAPGGLGGMFGGKAKHAAAIEQARTDHAAAHERWAQSCQRLRKQHEEAVATREVREQRRLAALAKEQEKYAEECRAREADAAEHNASVDRLINELAFDVEPAIQEYVGIVLSNSVYPEAFPVEYEHSFTLAERELTLSVRVPEPATLPAVKEYKYVKARDEITSTTLSVKAQKDRYSSAVWQVAVRTLHEIFEADRAGKIRSIALTVGTQAVAPATGKLEDVPFVQVAAARETFDAYDLANVVPEATLAHLGAAISKSPFDLTSAPTGPGVRRRTQG